MNYRDIMYAVCSHIFIPYRLNFLNYSVRVIDISVTNPTFRNNKISRFDWQLITVEERKFLPVPLSQETLQFPGDTTRNRFSKSVQLAFPFIKP